MLSDMSQNHDKSPSDPAIAPSPNRDGERDTTANKAIGVPTPVAGSGSLDRLVDTARDYARQATAENTNTAYKADWAHFSRWCRRRGAEPLPPSPELIGLYIANCAAPDTKAPALSVSTIERLSPSYFAFCQLCCPRPGRLLFRLFLLLLKHISPTLLGL